MIVREIEYLSTIFLFCHFAIANRLGKSFCVKPAVLRQKFLKDRPHQNVYHNGKNRFFREGDEINFEANKRYY